MANGNISWKYALGIGSSIIALLLGLNGWLLSQGFGSIDKTINKNAAAIERLCEVISKLDSENKSRDYSMIRRMDRMEVLITMPFEKRVEVLKNLQNLPTKNE